MARLEKLKIKGFRGFYGLYTFDLGHDSVLLFGQNGTGKSSLLNAIEFALFGEIEHFRGEEFSLTRDEIVNSFSPRKEAIVELFLTLSDGEQCSIKRMKKLGEKATSIALRMNEMEFDGKDAQDKIDEIMKLSLIDFHSSVYLRQGLLRDIVIGAPRERAEAIDSLIGIRDIDEILGSIPIGYAFGKIDDLKTMIDKVEAEKIGATKAFERDIEEMTSVLNKKGFFGPMTIDSVTEFHQRIVSRLHQVEKITGLRKKRISKPKPDLDGISKFITQLTEYHRSLFRETGTRIEAIRSKRNRADNFLRIARRQLHTLKELKEQEHVALGEYKWNQIDGDIASKRSELGKLRRRAEPSNKRIAMFENALSIIKSKRGIRRCPLCNTRFDRSALVKHIQTQLENAKEDPSLIEFQRRIDDLQQEIMKLQMLKDRMSDSEREFVSVKDSLFDSYRDLEISEIAPLDDQAFQLGIKSFIKQLSVLQERLVNRTKDFKEQEERINNEKYEMLKDIEKDIDTLRILFNVLEREQQLINLKNVLPEAFRDKSNLEAKLNKLEEYGENLQQLCKYLEKSRKKAAKEILEALEPQINQIYRRLRPHPVYDMLELEIKRGRGRAGKRLFSYMIKAAHTHDKQVETFVKTRFSHAQMSIAGLSIYLALVLGAPHRLEVIILDEPDQSLDLDHKENLAAILRDLQQHKQIIVSTQDEDFQRILLEQLVPPSGKSRIVYDLHDWDPDRGPRVTKTIQQAPEI